jgi:hypothetical protein
MRLPPVLNGACPTRGRWWQQGVRGRTGLVSSPRGQFDRPRDTRIGALLRRSEHCLRFRFAIRHALRFSLLRFRSALLSDRQRWRARVTEGARRSIDGRGMYVHRRSAHMYIYDSIYCGARVFGEGVCVESCRRARGRRRETRWGTLRGMAGRGSSAGGSRDEAAPARTWSARLAALPVT